ncbi:MAG: N-acetylneuraminate synthase [Spirochaetes bacterium]|nr:N-acetylneuraminate synthase [Spirochaetota bacterium]
MKTERVFIIAEAGVNHQGSLDTAKKLVDAAKEAGADACKFQTFRADSIISRFAPKAGYQERTTDPKESQLAMVRRLELDKKSHEELFRHCGKRGIVFLSSPFDIESVRFLNDLGLAIFKIPSGEITNLPYLREVGRLKKKVVMSTGMATLQEVGAALEVLIGCGTKKKAITVLHCNTEYPTQPEDVNLRAMLTIRDRLGVKVGYSDHTLGIEVPIAAAALGAEVIEKHFTLDRDMKGPDHHASLLPDELKSMVDAVRIIGKAMGDGKKKPSESEKKNMAAARKSIVAARDIEKGETFTAENVTVKRPATGVSPMRWDDVIGKTAVRRFREDEPITV